MIWPVLDLGRAAARVADLKRQTHGPATLAAEISVRGSISGQERIHLWLELPSPGARQVRLGCRIAGLHHPASAFASPGRCTNAVRIAFCAPLQELGWAACAGRCCGPCERGRDGVTRVRLVAALPYRQEPRHPVFRHHSEYDNRRENVWWSNLDLVDSDAELARPAL